MSSTRKNSGIIRLREGEFNPLSASEYRNKECVCGSQIKAKKCCGRPSWGVLTDRAYATVVHAMNGRKRPLHQILVEEGRKGQQVPEFVVEMIKNLDKKEAQEKIAKMSLKPELKMGDQIELEDAIKAVSS